MIFTISVATAPTVYGIETFYDAVSLVFVEDMLQQHLPFTVLKPCAAKRASFVRFQVATAPTVYGIETIKDLKSRGDKDSQLQQHLPFTVLKQRSF